MPKDLHGPKVEDKCTSTSHTPNRFEGCAWMLLVYVLALFIAMASKLHRVLADLA